MQALATAGLPRSLDRAGPQAPLRNDEAHREVWRRALLKVGWVLAGWDPENVSWQFQHRDGSRLLITAETLPEAMRILLAQLGCRPGGAGRDG